MAKRDTYNYQLKDGNKIVYEGITNNPSRRLNEHLNAGKRFTKMEHNTYPTSRSTAKTREAEGLAHYRSTHNGNNPKYNKTDHG